MFIDTLLLILEVSPMYCKVQLCQLIYLLQNYYCFEYFGAIHIQDRFGYGGNYFDILKIGLDHHQQEDIYISI